MPDIAEAPGLFNWMSSALAVANTMERILSCCAPSVKVARASASPRILHQVVGRTGVESRCVHRHRTDHLGREVQPEVGGRQGVGLCGGRAADRRRDRAIAEDGTVGHVESAVGVAPAIGGGHVGAGRVERRRGQHRHITLQDRLHRRPDAGIDGERRATHREKAGQEAGRRPKTTADFARRAHGMTSDTVVVAEVVPEVPLSVMADVPAAVPGRT